MSVLYENELGYFISHSKLISKIYNNVLISDNNKSFQLSEKLFDIKYPYKRIKLINTNQTNSKNKRKLEDSANDELHSEGEYVKNVYKTFRNNLIENKIIEDINVGHGKNEKALVIAENIYNSSGSCNILNIRGENKNDSIGVSINNETYLFPKNCKFYCSSVEEMGKHLENEKYDLILLDPPWWNKYIRRKKKKSDNSYSMMYNTELRDLPIEKLIKDNGLVVIWCTNSASNLNYLQNEIFEKWNLKYLGKWYWLKVTVNCEPVCNFSEPPGKQPFEQILFISKDTEKYKDLIKPKLVVSIPSALHSHKPPLQEVLENFLPNDAKCLEIFARYLLPNWTSYGLEAIRFQHFSLYEENNINT